MSSGERTIGMEVADRVAWAKSHYDAFVFAYGKEKAATLVQNDVLVQKIIGEMALEEIRAFLIEKGGIEPNETERLVMKYKNKGACYACNGTGFVETSGHNGPAEKFPCQVCKAALCTDCGKAFSEQEFRAGYTVCEKCEAGSGLFKRHVKRHAAKVGGAA